MRSISSVSVRLLDDDLFSCCGNDCKLEALKDLKVGRVFILMVVQSGSKELRTQSCTEAQV